MYSVNKLEAWALSFGATYRTCVLTRVFGHVACKRRGRRRESERLASDATEDASQSAVPALQALVCGLLKIRALLRPSQDSLDRETSLVVVYSELLHVSEDSLRSGGRK